MYCTCWTRFYGWSTILGYWRNPWSHLVVPTSWHQNVDNQQYVMWGLAFTPFPIYILSNGSFLLNRIRIYSSTYWILCCYHGLSQWLQQFTVHWGIHMEINHLIRIDFISQIISSTSLPKHWIILTSINVCSLLFSSA